MKTLGKVALASRSKIMLGIGWEIGSDIQADWVECVETVMAGCPGSNVLSVAISIGASREMLQGDIHSLGIERQKNKNPNWGWRHVTKYGQLASQCAEKGPQLQHRIFPHAKADGQGNAGRKGHCRGDQQADKANADS